MKFPFVSRDRLQEMQERFDACDRERRLLLDRLALLRGEPPIHATPGPLAEAVVKIPAGKVEAVEPQTHREQTRENRMPKIMAGSVTFDEVLVMADKASRSGTLYTKTKVS